MSRRTWAIAGCAVLILAAALEYYRNQWLNELSRTEEVSVRNFGLTIAKALGEGKPIDAALCTGFVRTNPRTGYLVIMSFRNGHRSGVIQSSILNEGTREFTDYFRIYGDEKTLSRLTKRGEGFAGEYLSVVSATLVPLDGERRVMPVGLVKAGFVVPGYPLGKGYVRILWGLLGMGGLVLLLASISPSRPLPAHRDPEVRIQLKPIQLVSTDDPDISDLEEALDEDTTTVIDEYGQEWKILFDGKSLDGWKIAGDVYITERELAAQPWASSAINETVHHSGGYYFSCRARRLAGEDGFVVLFMVDGKPQVWVVGGWQNTRSELAGYERTRAQFTAERFRWYKLEIRVEADKVEALIDDQIAWSLKRSELSTPSPVREFAQGVGVGVWNSFAKYREMRYLPKPDRV